MPTLHTQTDHLNCSHHYLFPSMQTTGTACLLFDRLTMIGVCLVVALAWAGLVVNAQQNDVRINFGTATNYTDLRKRVWNADPYTTFGKAGGVSCANDPIGTYFDPVYCTYRSFAKATTNNMPFLMNLPVPQPGQYQVRLHFSETVSWSSPAFPSILDDCCE